MAHLRGPKGEDICACTLSDYREHHPIEAESADRRAESIRIEALHHDVMRRILAGVPLRHMVPRRPGVMGWLRERWTDVVQIVRDGRLS
jgi:hypothetical protein